MTERHSRQLPSCERVRLVGVKDHSLSSRVPSLSSRYETQLVASLGCGQVHADGGGRGQFPGGVCHAAVARLPVRGARRAAPRAGELLPLPVFPTGDLGYKGIRGAEG
jgi:hypothetical protein